MQLWSYGCAWEAYYALTKLLLHSAIASCYSFDFFALPPECIHNSIVARYTLTITQWTHGRAWVNEMTCAG